MTSCSSTRPACSTKTPRCALLTIADENRARVVLMGDRHQLPAVGRGGVLDLAAACAPPPAQLTLEVVHRFDDPAYADLSLLMRRGERTGEVFDRLLARGEIRIHATDVERRQALTMSPDSSSPTPTSRSTPSTPPSATAACGEARSTLGSASPHSEVNASA